MEKKKLSDLPDHELLEEVKKRKTTSLMNAVIIGFLVGIICYSIWKNTLGLFTLIPLYIIYRLINKSKYDTKEMDQLLKDRHLK